MDRWDYTFRVNRILPAVGDHEPELGHCVRLDQRTGIAYTYVNFGYDTLQDDELSPWRRSRRSRKPPPTGRDGT